MSHPCCKKKHFSKVELIRYDFILINNGVENSGRKMINILTVTNIRQPFIHKVLLGIGWVGGNSEIQLEVVKSL